MVKLVELARVKDVLGIAKADTVNNTQLQDIIAQASDEAEQYCRRRFTYALRTEYFPSYDQHPRDPDPQYAWVDGPIDPQVAIQIIWAPYQDHANIGIQLTSPQDFRVDYDKSAIVIGNGRATLLGQPTAVLIYPFITYSSTGFQITYAGGYPILTPTPIPNTNPDPMDDYDVVSVPAGLKSILLRKIASDYNTIKMLQPWTDDEISSLRPYQKKNRV